jgi:hypothetical protein
MKGGIKDNGKESQRREEEGRQEALSRIHPYEKKGAAVAPFSIAATGRLLAPANSLPA